MLSNMACLVAPLHSEPSLPAPCSCALCLSSATSNPFQEQCCKTVLIPSAFHRHRTRAHRAPPQKYKPAWGPAPEQILFLGRGYAGALHTQVSMTLLPRGPVVCQGCIPSVLPALQWRPPPQAQQTLPAGQDAQLSQMAL